MKHECDMGRYDVHSSLEQNEYRDCWFENGIEWL
jgi:hypothetical protein